MTDPRGSKSLSLEDLTECGWETAVANIAEPGYSGLHDALMTAAKADENNVTDRHRSALGLLAGC